MRIRILAGCAALALLGGCAPQLYFAAGPASCSPMQAAAYHRPGIGARMNRVQALQARFSLGSSYAARSSTAGWRDAASGECTAP